MPDDQPGSRRRLHLVYAGASRDLVAPLARALEAAGFAVDWPPAGSTVTADGADTAAAIIVCWTPAAIASDAVNLQAARARKAGKLLPILLAPCTPPVNLGRLGISDLSGWRGDPGDPDFLALVQSIHARLSGRVLSVEFWRSHLFSWGGAGALGVAALTVAINFGGLKQAFDGVFNPAASERALTVTDAKVDEVLELLKGKAGKPLDAGAEAVMRESIARLLSAQDGARRSAADKLEKGDLDGAIAELQSAADEGEKAVARQVETLKDVGALAFPERTLEAVAAYERAAQLAPDDLDSRLLLGELYVRLGHFDKAKEAYLFVSEHSAGAEDRVRATALTGLGFISLKRGDPVEAESYLNQTVALNEEIGDIDGQAAAYAELGLLRQTSGDLKGAEKLFKRSLELFLKSNNLIGQGVAHLRLGNAALRRGDTGAAEKSFNQALAISRQLEDSEGRADALGNLGDVARARGDANAARKLYLESLELAQQISAHEIQAFNLTSLGELAAETGDKAEAIKRLQEARGLYKMMELTGDMLDVERQLKDLGATPSPEGAEN